MILLLCSCATENSVHPRLPATVTMNKEAGRGGLLIIKLRLENGEKASLVVDSGMPIVVFDKSYESKLGKRLGTGSLWNFGVEQKVDVYAAPRLFLKGTPLMAGTNVVTFDSKQLS